MLHKQRLSTFAIQSPAAERVGLSMLGGTGYFSASPSWNKDREDGG
jgi:hypothetical protein